MLLLLYFEERGSIRRVPCLPLLVHSPFRWTLVVLMLCGVGVTKHVPVGESQVASLAAGAVSCTALPTCWELGSQLPYVRKGQVCTMHPPYTVCSVAPDKALQSTTGTILCTGSMNSDYHWCSKVPAEQWGALESEGPLLSGVPPTLPTTWRKMSR